jgi:hypothetical protein
MPDNVAIVVTVEDAKNPGLLVRLLRTISDRIATLGNRIEEVARSIVVPSMDLIRRALQSDGTHPLNISNLRGIAGDPQPAGMLRYTSSPTGLILQNLRDTQLFAVKNGVAYDVYMVIGGNPNTATLILSGVAAGAHNILSATHTDTLVGTVVRGDVIVGNSTPKWSRLAKGSANQVFRMDGTGTDPGWGAVADGALSGNVVLYTGTSAFSANQTFNAAATFNGAVRFGVFSFAGGTQTLGTERFISIDVSGGIATAKFPAAPTTGDWYYIIDTNQNAGTNNITLDGNGKNINGAATKVMNTNGAVAYYFYIRHSMDRQGMVS